LASITIEPLASITIEPLASFLLLVQLEIALAAQQLPIK
jgi:hypothetical protein